MADTDRSRSRRRVRRVTFGAAGLAAAGSIGLSLVLAQADAATTGPTTTGSTNPTGQVASNQASSNQSAPNVTAGTGSAQTTSGGS